MSYSESSICYTHEADGYICPYTGQECPYRQADKQLFNPDDVRQERLGRRPYYYPHPYYHQPPHFYQRPHYYQHPYHYPYFYPYFYPYYPMYYDEDYNEYDDYD